MESLDEVFGSNQLKLGAFAYNVDGGMTGTKVPDRYRLSWDTVKQVARAAEDMGFEMQLPLARWRSLGGETQFCGTNFDPMVWAAGLAEATSVSNIFATYHMSLIHPIVAAKQMTTVDHISGGRFGINVVNGRFPEEWNMFGLEYPDHDDMYDAAGEWLEIVEMLWTREEEFDFEGKYYQIKKGFAQPKPLRGPRPPIMNAGASPRGAQFAAKYADIAFAPTFAYETSDVLGGRVDHIQRMAREEFHRDIRVWGGAWVICKPTEKEAREYYAYLLYDNGDEGALAGIPPLMFPPTDGLDPEAARRARNSVLGGWGGAQLIGTPEQIVDELITIAAAGIDGLVLNWVDYVEGLETWKRDVLPLMEQAGLRRPVQAPEPVGV